MGTRHLICVVQGGEFKVAQYGQWDGYPEGAGSRVIAWLAVPGNVRRLADGARRTMALSAEVTNALIASRRAASHKNPMGQFSRDVGADILEYVASDPLPQVFLDAEFAGDSLMCEWVYVVDLDASKLEVYKGFNKAEVAMTERFASFETPETARGMGYRPVKLVVSFDLSELDATTVEKIESLLDKESE